MSVRVPVALRRRCPIGEALLAAAVLLVGCNGEVLESPGAVAMGGGTAAAPPTASQLFAPDRSTFNPVANMLQVTCGTLDCHGQIGRNLRLYGARGLRLDPKDNSAENPTTPGEYDQSYWSVIGLEPEIASEVVAAAGARPERLTLVRKARGLERHKGGTLMASGDAADRCLIAWLAGRADGDACKEVSDRPRPPAPEPAPP